MTLLPPYLQKLLYIAYVAPFFLAMAAFFALQLRQHKSKSHKALSYMFLSAAIIVLVFTNQFFFSYSGANHIVLHYPNMLIGLLCAPAIIIYFMALLRPGIINTRQVLIYLFPTFAYIIITVILQLVDMYPKTYFTRKLFVKEIFSIGNIVRLSVLSTYICQMISYGIIIVRALNTFRKTAKNKYSYTEGVNLKWAYWALLAVATFAIVPLSMLLFEFVQPWMLLIHSIIATSAICIMFFAGNAQPVLYEDEDKDGYKKEEEPIRDLSLPLDNRERLRKDIVELFEEKKCFQDNNLSVDNVAQELKTNRTYISRVINEEFGMNFYGFVNKYRMAEFMRLLQESEDPSTFKIKEMSEQVGFKSYTSFYNFFKENTNYTPREYIKQL